MSHAQAKYNLTNMYSITVTLQNFHCSSEVQSLECLHKGCGASSAGDTVAWQRTRFFI